MFGYFLLPITVTCTFRPLEPEIVRLAHVLRHGAPFFYVRRREDKFGIRRNFVTTPLSYTVVWDNHVPKEGWAPAELSYHAKHIAIWDGSQAKTLQPRHFRQDKCVRSCTCTLLSLDIQVLADEAACQGRQAGHLLRANAEATASWRLRTAFAFLMRAVMRVLTLWVTFTYFRTIAGAPLGLIRAYLEPEVDRREGAKQAHVV